jgi:hypothetical protein
MPRFLATLLAILIAFVAIPGTPVDARGPDLRLRPNDGPAGITVLARGRDFPPGASGTIAWGDLSRSFGEFTADANGEFAIPITAPDLPPGDYTVSAISAQASDVATDTFTIEPPATDDDAARVPDAATPQAVLDGVVAPVAPQFVPNACDGPGHREVVVTTAAELETALAAAQPGDRINLMNGTYLGNFVAAVDGTADAPVTLCGTRAAILDGGDWGASGYALHLQGDHWTVSGITVTNAQKGVMADGVTGVVLDGIEVHTIGHEAVHFRTHSTGNVIQRSDVHDTGLDNEKFGEGVYLGTSVSNWERYTNGEPDRSDGNRVLGNRIWSTTSESVDIKEGTEGGEVIGNVFEGSLLTGADSWVDVKGNGYLIQGNLGVNSPQDGFKTHVIDDMEWGRDNVFERNTATVNGPGVGFYIHQPEETNNTVACDNVVEGAAGGFTNLPAGCTG